MVAHAPLEYGDGVQTYLDALVRYGKWKDNTQIVKGVCRLIQSESPDFCLHPNFVRGVQVIVRK